MTEVVVITGASAGVGRAVTQRFARQGAKIGLIARGREGLEATKKEVEQLGGEAYVCCADVANFYEVQNAADEIETALGPIDIWVNNAMASVFSPVTKMKPEDYKRVTEVTYLGTVHGTLAALKYMTPRNKGVIVEVGSALAYRGIPLQSAYCAAKHAVQGFVDSLQCELLHDKSAVRLCMIQLPAINTPQFDWVKSHLPKKAQPVPPIFQPEVIAEAIDYIAHHKRREMYVAWPTYKAIIGNKIAPRYADKYLAKNGFDSQQTHEDEEKNRRDNLYQPLPGDHGAHGRFDKQAKNFSAFLWITMHRKTILLSTLGLFALVGIFKKNFAFKAG